MKLTTPSSGEVKNEWIYNSTSPYAFMAWKEIILISSEHGHETSGSD
jgi:2-hydroxychromene-2-carboxylate isomerase